MGKKNRTRPKSKKLEQHATSVGKLTRNWVLGLILGVTLLTFANTVFNGFAYDDNNFILRNEVLHSLSNIPTVLTKELWFYRVLQDKDPNKETGPTTPYYRPAFSLFHMLCWQLFGAHPAGWHVTNVLVHLLAVYFVFLILERLTGDYKITGIATVLFAIHPLRVESVAWICGVSDPFLAVFLLPSLYLYMRYRDDGKQKLLAGSLGLSFLAVFTKEPAVALAIFVAAYELFIINNEKSVTERIKPAIKYCAAFLVVSALYLAARYFALGFVLNNSNYRSYPLNQIVLTIPLVVWKYLGLLVWPVNLSLFHSTEMIETPLDIRFLLPMVGMIPLVYGMWLLRRSTIARFAILWFAINLLPVLNLSAFSEEFMVQERYVYIPSIGFSLLVAMGLVKIPVEKWLRARNRRTVQASIVAVIVFLFAGKSFALNTTWKDDMTVWFHGEETAPDQAISHYILGHKLLKASDYPRAAEQFEDYMKLNSKNDIVIGNLAATYVLIYQYQAAENPATADPAILDRSLDLCEQGLKLTPDSSPLWDSLGSIFTFETGLKNYDRAIACFQRGLSLTPKNAMINFHLGGTLVKRGNPDEGIPFLKTALQLQPEIVDAHKFLAYAYKSKGQLKEAVDELNTYLKLEPNAPDAPKVSKDAQDMRALLNAASPQS